MSSLRVASTMALLLSATLYLGCNGGTESAATGTGGKAGSSASGGSPGRGGDSSSGGSLGSGGSASTGGSGQNSGGSASGGSSGFGGASSSGGSGGNDNTGGNVSSSGSSGKPDSGTPDSGQGDSRGTGGSASGGSVGTGGSSLGGMPGAGGATSSTFWPSAYTATTGSSGMNTGQDCMSSCHRHGFAFGGTVYDSSGKPKSQAQIGIKLTNGQFVSVFSGGDGNFHYSGSGLNIAGADIRVRDANGESQMPMNPTSSGACNSCHTGTGTPRISAP
jgi:hypothetical protein